MDKTYNIIDYITGEKHLGHRGREYSDVDIARFWAIKKSLDLGATIALYDGTRILNIYKNGKPFKRSSGALAGIEP